MRHGDGPPEAPTRLRPPAAGGGEPTAAENDDSLRYRLALLRAPGVGPSTFRQLLDAFGSPRHLFEAGRDQLRHAGIAEPLLNYLRAPAWDAVEADLDWRARPGNHILCRGDAAWPVLLNEISDAPPLLFVHGDITTLAMPQLAIVGSRNPTPAGTANAAALAAALAGAGLAITSGLALGIDAAAHRGALEAGGTTLAVAGNGLDRVYPARHRALAHAVSASGALLSEFPPGTPPRAGHFPRRNRLISGLSLGTLVVEAAPRSGSLITARLAAEQGREVFAIPGSIHNPLARGCHALLRQGAKLVESAHDIIEELAPLAALVDTASTSAAAATAPPLTPPQTALLEQIGFDPVSIDTLVARCRLTADSVSSMILVLELHGYVTRMTDGRYLRCGHRH
jgi:DNA processing protein